MEALRRALDGLERALARVQAESRQPVGAAAGGGPGGRAADDGRDPGDDGPPPGTVEGEFREM
jgi:hypothetical protein